MNIAIIEDDEKIREELAILLKKENYTPHIITNFENILEEILKIPCDLILLDINLPYEDGFTICEKIKKEKDIPIIFVTSRSKEEDELKSIRLGGIDFLAKPYNKLILLEKIKRALNITNPIHYQEITINDVTLNLHLSTIKKENTETELTRNEFRILYYFFLKPHELITKEDLLESLWNDKYYLDENILNVSMNRLRKKLEEIGAKDFIKTKRGVGYYI